MSVTPYEVIKTIQISYSVIAATKAFVSDEMINLVSKIGDSEFGLALECLKKASISKYPNEELGRAISHFESAYGLYEVEIERNRFRMFNQFSKKRLPSYINNVNARFFSICCYIAKDDINVVKNVLYIPFFKAYVAYIKQFASTYETDWHHNDFRLKYEKEEEAFINFFLQVGIPVNDENSEMYWGLKDEGGGGGLNYGVSPDFYF